MGGGALAMGRLQGPGAPLEGVAQLVALGLSVVLSVAFIACIKLRPAKESLTPFNLLVSVTAYGLLAGTVYFLPRAAARYTLTVQVLDTSRKPIEGAQVAQVDYRSRSHGLDEVKDTDSTDAQGRVTIRAHNEDSLAGTVTHPGYRGVSYQVDSLRLNSHKLVISTKIPGDIRNEGFGFFDSLPPGKEVLLTIYLSRNEEGDELPYPSFDPAKPFQLKFEREDLPGRFSRVEIVDDGRTIKCEVRRHRRAERTYLHLSPEQVRAVAQAIGRHRLVYLRRRYAAERRSGFPWELDLRQDTWGKTSSFENSFPDSIREFSRELDDILPGADHNREQRDSVR
jgi:hypothetical protein